MFYESFGFPWESKKLNEEYENLPLDEKIKHCTELVFGENPDTSNPLFQEYKKTMDFIREHAKKEE